MDNTVVESCTVENINVVLYPGDTFKELSGVTATYKSNDRADGTDVERELNGTYLVRNGAYWRTYGDYCVSYGDSSYDPPVTGETIVVANSEYSVSKYFHDEQSGCKCSRFFLFFSKFRLRPGGFCIMMEEETLKGGSTHEMPQMRRRNEQRHLPEMWLYPDL